MDGTKDLASFIALGKECGLSGPELLAFAKGELTQYQNTERDRRAWEREEKEKDRQAQREEKEKEREAEREKNRLEKELEKDRLAHDLELKRLELQSDDKSQNDNGQNKSSDRKCRGPNPKLTIFNEKTDQLDAWFDVFDRQCDLLNVADPDKISHLLATFHGKYLNAILAIKGDSSYLEIKKSMLVTFNLTSNDYRKKFFTIKPETNETFAGFVQRLETSLDKWIELSGKEKDYDSLRQLLISHKIFDTCNESLVSHLLERSITDVSLMETQATAFFQAHSNLSLGQSTDAYLNAHAAYPDRARPPFRRNRSNNFGSQNRDHSSSRFQNRSNSHNSYEKRWSGDKTDRKHNTGNRGFQREIRCFHCHKLGHKVNECKKFEEQRKEYFKNNKLDFQSQDKIPASFAHPQQFGIRDCGSTLIEDPSSCHQLSSDLKPWETKHVYSGLLKHGSVMKPVAVLRDTGSAVHAIHDKFITHDQLTGKFQKLITFGGKCKKLPTCKG